MLHNRKKLGIDIDDNLLAYNDHPAQHRGFHFDYTWSNLLWIIIAIFMSLLIARIFYLTIINHKTYATIASGNTIRKTPIIAPRGKILSHDGVTLADNIPNYSAVLLAKDLPDEIATLPITEIAQQLEVDKDYLFDQITLAKKTQKNIVIQEQLSHEQEVSIASREKDYPFIHLQKNTLRTYRDGPLFAHVIGYEGLIQQKEFQNHEGYLFTDRIGKSGMELMYENDLHGTHGYKQSLHDSQGQFIKDIETIDVIPGGDLYLHIDYGLQKKITEALQKQLTRADTTRAAAIALDPRSGAVRALVSIPSYDNNAFAQGIGTTQYTQWITDENRPLFNRAISGTYPPGSTVKPVLGVAVLEEHIIDPFKQIESRGGLHYGKFFFGDWKVHGFTDLRRAIAVSSDVYFYTVAGGYGSQRGLGIDKMHAWYDRFGYGHPTGIDLSPEAHGINPDPAWKKTQIGQRWYIGDTYHSAIGQGFMTATPLQVANTIATIANGGTQYVPHIAQKVIYNDGTEKNIAPQITLAHIANPQNIRIVQEGMRKTVTEGTGQMLKNLSVAVAGKTGTAEFGTEGRVHSWFVSYAPYENPEIVLLIMVEGQTRKISSATLPVALEVYKWYYEERQTTDNL